MNACVVAKMMLFRCSGILARFTQFGQFGNSISRQENSHNGSQNHFKMPKAAERRKKEQGPRRPECHVNGILRVCKQTAFDSGCG